MADPTRRQIAMMADEVGITDYPAAVRLVRRAFEVSRSARAALAADGPAVQSREPASVVGESIDDDAELDEPLGDLIDKWCQEGMQVKPYGTPFPLAHYVASKAYQYGLSKGHQPTPPAEGEVAELVARLRRASDGASAMGWEQDSWVIARAAELLQQQHPTPVPVSERLPEPNTKVLAHYFNALGNGRTICAIWVPAKSRSEDSGDDDFTEYDEENDTYYWPEGWYEAIENWDDLGWVAVNEGEVAYWQPLPKWPALPLPQGEVEK